MSSEVAVVLVPAIAVFLTALANLIQSRVNARKLDTAQATAQDTHDLVNSTNTEQAARVAQLTALLTEHGITVPPERPAAPGGLPGPPGTA
jgi:hypothetical protein